jgi:hypothetical protein
MEEECPICEKGILTNMVERENSTYKGITEKTDLHYSFCSYCESNIANCDQLKKNKQIMIDFKKYVDDLSKIREK